MSFLKELSATIKLLAAIMLLAACSDEEGIGGEQIASSSGGVFVLCEGNYNSGNATLSYYDTETKTVENGVFQRVNQRKLGDTGQSILIHNGVAYVAVENSGIVWGINTSDFKVKGQLTAGPAEHMIDPRYIHLVSETKAYVTDLYSPYITIFNPQTFTYLGSIATGQNKVGSYASTEQMAQWDKYVFTNCWCYSKNILVIDTERDAVCDSIVLSSWQPKSIKMDGNGKLWCITDGGYSSGTESFGDGQPHLYRIDAKTRQIELDLTLPTDEASVQLALSPKKDILYLINNDIYRMAVTDNTVPTTPFINAPLDNNGKRHKLYGIDVNPDNGDIYVADAVDYAQSGVAYRYSSDGTLIDQFRVGINPNGFAFSSGTDIVVPGEQEEESASLQLVDTVYEYMPAPGHWVNGYKIVGDFIHDGATMQEACDTVMSHFQKQWMVSLGAQGGYLVAGFKKAIKNRHYGTGPSTVNNDYELVVRGNPYSYQSEPGIVWVMKDENGDGLPNETWYELAGSEYGTSNETTGYAISYIKPTEAEADIHWFDNQGGEDIVPYMKNWNTHPYYWQDWVPTTGSSDKGAYRTYYGSRLKDTHTYDATTGLSDEPPFAWGYVDNLGSDTQTNRTYLRLDNAVKADGTPANLDEINFIKIQTAQTGYTSNLGDISTEVYGIWGR